MAQIFPQERYPFMRYFIGDVRNRDRLDMAMRDVVRCKRTRFVGITLYEGETEIEDNVSVVRTGRGMLFYPDGDSYVGEIRRGDFHGSGKYTWGCGMSYKGQLRHNFKHGAGRIRFVDGSSFEGTFGNAYDEETAAELMVGTGVFRRSDGGAAAGCRLVTVGFEWAAAAASEDQPLFRLELADGRVLGVSTLLGVPVTLHSLLSFRSLRGCAQVERAMAHRQGTWEWEDRWA